MLVLLWGFVAAAIVAIRHDVFGTRPRRIRPVAAPPAAAAPKPAKPAPDPKPARRGRAAPTRVAVIEGAGQGTAVTLSSLPVTIGRASDSTIVVSDDYASNKHARLVPDGSGWKLEDLGSTNGTVLDGTRVTAAVPVHAGSKITIGRTVLELQ
jgi:pSer/pThr/pTyr-binding forkhead associated (FHA) protein